MKQATRLFAACVWVATSLSPPGMAYADGGRISFSGALVNASCQLSTTMPPVSNGARQATVSASLCGDAPTTFSTTVPVSNSATVIGTGIAQLLIQETANGPILEVSYN